MLGFLGGRAVKTPSPAAEASPDLGSVPLTSHIPSKGAKK